MTSSNAPGRPELISEAKLSLKINYVTDSANLKQLIAKADPSNQDQMAEIDCRAACLLRGVPYIGHEIVNKHMIRCVYAKAKTHPYDCFTASRFIVQRGWYAPQAVKNYKKPMETSWFKKFCKKLHAMWKRRG